MQATAYTYDPETRCGSVLLDDGTPLPFDAAAFDAGACGCCGPGQRVRIEVDGEGDRPADHLGDAADVLTTRPRGRSAGPTTAPRAGLPRSPARRVPRDPYRSSVILCGAVFLAVVLRAVAFFAGAFFAGAFLAVASSRPPSWQWPSSRLRAAFFAGAVFFAVAFFACRLLGGGLLGAAFLAAAFLRAEHRR